VFFESVTLAPIFESNALLWSWDWHDALGQRVESHHLHAVLEEKILHGLCGSVYKQYGIALLDIPDEYVRTERSFQVNRETLLRKAFDVSALETSQRKFAFEVKSNGYAALVLLQRPMTVKELAEPRKKSTTRRKGKRHDGQGTDPDDEVNSRLPD